MIQNKMTLQERRALEAIVDRGDFSSCEAVADFFRAYTLLIWDHFLVGRIYDCYTDDIVMHHAGGASVQGLDAVFKNTLAVVASAPRDSETIFVDIFAEGNEAEGYRFMQLTAAYSPQALGRNGRYVKPEDCVYADDGVGSVGMCECSVKKVDGRWVITEEWLLRTVGKKPGAAPSDAATNRT